MTEAALKPKDRIKEALLKARRVFLSSDVNENTAREIIEQMWYLALQDSEAPILFVINSPGGSVDAGFAIWDQVKMLPCPVYTLVTGLAASMGSILSLCASKGKRFSTPNSRIMIHQPRIGGTIQGQATDLEIQAKEIIKTRKRLVNLYVEATGKKYEEIDRALDRDAWMTAEEAKKFGLLDGIVNSFNDL